MAVEDKRLGNLEMVIELKMSFDLKMFEKLYYHHKAKFELETRTKKKQIARVYQFIKQISNAFTNIKFDMLRSFFYNEIESERSWSMRKSRFEEGPEELEAKNRRKEHHDCCYLI